MKFKKVLSVALAAVRQVPAAETEKFLKSAESDL